MNLVYYHPIAITNKHPFQKCVNPLISVMDRTTNHWPNFEYKNLFPMPMAQAFEPDFMEISISRAMELTSGQENINILWSGGIDSTFILCLFESIGILSKLKNSGRLIIGLNGDSIKEYPGFYQKFLLKNYGDCLVQANTILENPLAGETIITGEMADNLVGSLTMKSCVDYHNDFSIVHKNKQIAIDWLGRNLVNDEREILREFIWNVCENSPVELMTCHDLLWYLNFNFKWQAVNFRIVSHATNGIIGNILINNIKHFFNTEQFQQWSILRGHYFTGDSWKDYKIPLKKHILDVTGDTSYYMNKTKYPSLPSLLRFKDTFDFIYENNGGYEFTKKMVD